MVAAVIESVVVSSPSKPLASLPSPPPATAEGTPTGATPATGAAEGTKGTGRKQCRDLWSDCVFPQLRDIVLSSLRCTSDTIEHRKNSHELFGYDFMVSLDDSPSETHGLPRVWLIEVNSSPAMDYSTRVTTPLVKKVMEDSLRVLVDLPEDSSVDTGEWERIVLDEEQQVALRPSRYTRLEVRGTPIEIPGWVKDGARRRKEQQRVGLVNLGFFEDSQADGTP